MTTTDHEAEAALWSLLTLIANYNPAFVYDGQPMTLVDEVARLLAASKLALPDGTYKISMGRMVPIDEPRR